MCPGIPRRCPGGVGAYCASSDDHHVGGHVEREIAGEIVGLRQDDTCGQLHALDHHQRTIQLARPPCRPITLDALPVSFREMQADAHQLRLLHCYTRYQDELRGQAIHLFQATDLQVAIATKPAQEIAGAYSSNVPSANPNGSGSGRLQVLASSMCMPSREAWWKVCMMSRT